MGLSIFEVFLFILYIVVIIGLPLLFIWLLLKSVTAKTESELEKLSEEVKLIREEIQKLRKDKENKE